MIKNIQVIILQNLCFLASMRTKIMREWRSPGTTYFYLLNFGYYLDCIQFVNDLQSHTLILILIPITTLEENCHAQLN